MLHALPDHPAVATPWRRPTRCSGSACWTWTPGKRWRATAVSSSACWPRAWPASASSPPGCEPDLLMGLSIGAYPAAVAAGALDFADALRLVDLRGGSWRRPSGGLRHGRHPGPGPLPGGGPGPGGAPAAEPGVLANLNSADQMVISGADAALERVARLALAQHARKTTRLAVRVPSTAPLPGGRRGDGQGFRLRVPAPPGPHLPQRQRREGPVRSRPHRRRPGHNMARQVHWHDAATLAAERGMGSRWRCAPEQCSLP